jgi:Flp pilus assembly protein TadB
MAGAAAPLAIVAWLVTGSAAAGVVCLGYGLAAAQAVARRHSRATQARARADSLELLAAAAADLRAGAGAAPIVLPDPDLDRLARAAQRISDRTGAPPGRPTRPLGASAICAVAFGRRGHAQGAGIRASAALLLGLPLIGLALGHFIGANAAGVLLHTTIGQLCAALAVALQLGGLAWTDRLARAGRDMGSAASPLDRLLGRTRTDRLARAGRDTGSAASLLDRLLGRTRTDRLARAGRDAGSAASPLGRLLGRTRTRASTPTDAHGELAAAADLIAASLRAGAPVSTAVFGRGANTGGTAEPDPAADRHRLRLGVTPGEAWQPLSTIGSARRVVAAACRSAESGAALAGALTRCADDMRADAEHARQAKSQRAAVLLVLPLGLCFLPAFVLAGLVP